MTSLAERRDRGILEQLCDAEVAKRVCAGEAALFELIMRRHNRRLFRIARGILGNDADAEEAVQEAYVSAYFKLKQFRGPDGFTGWLCRIATNQALMQRRSRERARPASLRLDEFSIEETVAEREAPQGNPENSLHELQLHRLLEKAVDALPEVYRSAFILREIGAGVGLLGVVGGVCTANGVSFDELFGRPGWPTRGTTIVNPVELG